MQRSNGQVGFYRGAIAPVATRALSKLLLRRPWAPRAPVQRGGRSGDGNL